MNIYAVALTPDALIEVGGIYRIDAEVGECLVLGYHEVTAMAVDHRGRIEVKVAGLWLDIDVVDPLSEQS